MKIKFKNFEPLELKFDNSPTVDIWKKLFLDNLKIKLPMYRDQNKYQIEYLNLVYKQICELLHWDQLDLTRIENTVKAHKNIEVLLADGYSKIPVELDDLIHEFHYGLHTQEYNNFIQGWLPRHHIQLEWFTDEYEPLSEDFTHKLTMEFGDLRLQNAYVGHIPSQLYEQNDYSNLDQTCRFHDRIKAGLYIRTSDDTAININDYVKWWEFYAKDFVKKHGIDKILHYTGHPVIGKVANLEILREVANSKDVLEIENIYEI